MYDPQYILTSMHIINPPLGFKKFPQHNFRDVTFLLNPHLFQTSTFFQKIGARKLSHPDSTSARAAVTKHNNEINYTLCFLKIPGDTHDLINLRPNGSITLIYHLCSACQWNTPLVDRSNCLENHNRENTLTGRRRRGGKYDHLDRMKDTVCTEIRENSWMIKWWSL